MHWIQNSKNEGADKKEPDIGENAGKLEGYMSLLKIKNLSIQYKTDGEVFHAVNGIDLTIESGECFGLVGETGAGKTTTARGILRLIPDPPGKITDGEIFFKGEDLLKIREAQMRKVRGTQISMIFQDPMTALDPSMRIGLQIAEVLIRHGRCSKKDALQESLKTLEMVGINRERFDDFPHQLSGGMKQRVIIAIALVSNPALLIADEPTSALDVTIQAQVLEMMSELRRKLGTSVLLITHDLGVVAENCDRVAVMYAGEIVEIGSLRDVFKHHQHPYTTGLFGSIPSLTVKKKRLKPIAGMMPDPSDLPKGCYFSPRCPFASERCTDEHPTLTTVALGHQVRCFMARPDDQEVTENGE